MNPRKNTIDDVLKRLVICEPSTMPTGCWEWPGARANGYGRVGFGGKCAVVHRLVYVHFVGPVPDGLELDHLCRNRCCANFEHLEAVTGRMNKLRGVSPSAQCARKTHCSRGHEFSPENTRVTPLGKRSCRKCHVIHNTANRKRKWKPPPPRQPKTHCPHGHELSGDNLINDVVGGHPARRCRTCRREQARRSEARRQS